MCRRRLTRENADDTGKHTSAKYECALLIFLCSFWLCPTGPASSWRPLGHFRLIRLGHDPCSDPVSPLTLGVVVGRGDGCNLYFPFLLVLRLSFSICSFWTKMHVLRAYKYLVPRNHLTIEWNTPYSVLRTLLLDHFKRLLQHFPNWLVVSLSIFLLCHCHSLSTVHLPVGVGPPLSWRTADRHQKSHLPPLSFISRTTRVCKMQELLVRLFTRTPLSRPLSPTRSVNVPRGVMRRFGGLRRKKGKPNETNCHDASFSFPLPFSPYLGYSRGQLC